MKWSPQQAAALDGVGAWYKADDEQVRRVFGYAGTGKSTLAKHFADLIDGPTRYCAFTGKASIVMRKNGCADATTIHSLIYKVHQDQKTGEVSFRLDKDGPASLAALIVVDEVSMVDETLGRDLLSFGKPVLVLGDPAQLPPVTRGRNPAGFFTEAEPDSMLTEIHRQAADNPIIRLATDVREGRGLTPGEYSGSRVVSRAQLDPQDVVDADQILVGKNATRTAYNHRMREIEGYGDRYPMKDDRMVCLRNERERSLFNGGIFTVTRGWQQDEDERCVRFSVRSEDIPEMEALEVVVRKEFFDGGAEHIDWREKRGTSEFTYGYALTVHKSQGSQWGDVCLFDESGSFRADAARHLYTGITRAAERVTVIQ